MTMLASPPHSAAFVALPRRRRPLDRLHCRITLALKRVVDVTAAAVGLAVLLPIGGGVALAITLEDGLPVFYRARRAGQYGTLFTMYKFRTMRRDAATRGPAITGAADPRITRVGRILRASKLDELPQLWNVLRGEMSLVGPRPEDPSYVALYTDDQRAVLAVRPGITGPAQVVFRDEARLLRPGHVHEDYVTRVLPAKLSIDTEYVATLSVRRDIGALLSTVWAIIHPDASAPSVQAGMHSGKETQ